MHRLLVGIPEGKRSLGRSRRRWDDKIEMDLKQVGFDAGDCIDLAHDRVQWWACIWTAMNLQVH